MFRRKKEKSKFIITEGVEGTWHYHISKNDNQSKSLCGETTIYSNMSFDDWGMKPTHIPYSFCNKCKKKMDKKNG